MKTAKVYLKQRLHYLDHFYHYLVPDSAQIGQRGIFPYGKGNKETEGVIVDFSDIAQRELKEINYLIDESPLLSKEQLDLNKFITKKNLKLYYSSLKNFTELIKTYKNNKGIVKSHSPKVDYLVSLKEAKKVRGTIQKQIIDSLIESDKKFSELKKLIPKLTIKTLDRLSDLEILTYNKIEENKFNLISERKTSKKFIKLHSLNYFIELLTEILNQSEGQTLIVFPNFFYAKRFHEYLNNLEISNSFFRPDLKSNEAFDFYNNVKNGSIKIIISASNGLFLNFQNLENIIFNFVGDEMYMAGEKQDINSLEIVEKLADLNHSNLLLTDYLDSLISYEKIDKKEWQDLKEKSESLAFDYQLDHIDIQEEDSPIFSDTLKNALLDNFNNHEKTLLVLNRKGYYGCNQCKKCHEPIRCPRCGSILRSVQNGKKVECRVCDFTGNFPDECSYCGNKEFTSFQFGIEKILEEVKKLIPEAQITPLLSNYDGDINNSDIIVATKKILYVPKIKGIKTVGLVLPDIDLYFPDYHAPESAYRFYTELLSRYNDTNIIIQSQNFTNSLLKAIEGEQDQFWKEQSEYRKLAKVPPYNNIYIINMMAENSKIVTQEVKDFQKLLAEMQGVTILKPHVRRKGIPGWSKREFIVKDNKDGQLRDYIAQMMEKGEFERFNSRISIQVNPANIL